MGWYQRRVHGDTFINVSLKSYLHLPILYRLLTKCLTTMYLHFLHKTITSAWQKRSWINGKLPQLKSNMVSTSFTLWKLQNSYQLLNYHGTPPNGLSGPTLIMFGN